MVQVSEDDYHQQVAVPNVNKKDPDAIDARTVEQALEALDVSDTSEDRHPERWGSYEKSLHCSMLHKLHEKGCCTDLGGKDV